MWTRGPVVLFAELVICLNCGEAEFAVPQELLNQIDKRVT